MSLLTLLVIIILVGVAVYVIYRTPFIAQPFKSIAMIVALVVVGLLVLQAFGVLDSLRSISVPRFK